jgi:hypothetical protein
VCVPAVLEAMGTGVDHHHARRVVPSAADDVGAALGESLRVCPGWMRNQVPIGRQPGRAQKPDQLTARRPAYRGEIGASEQGCPHGERRARIVSGPLVQEKKATAIVVTNERHRAIRSRDPHQVVQQSAERALESRAHRHFGPFSQHQEVQVEVSRVAVIPGGLLDITPVATNMPVNPGEQDLRARPLPRGCLTTLRQRRAQRQTSPMPHRSGECWD